MNIQIKCRHKLLLRGTPALHLNEAADGSCCDAGLGLVWHCYCIYMTFVCLIQKNYSFSTFEGPSLCRIQKYDYCKTKIHYELIKSINNPSWLNQMQG